jgi:hypothetical protein
VGKRLGDEGTVRPAFRVPAELDVRLRELAAQRGRTISDEYRAAAEAWGGMAPAEGGGLVPVAEPAGTVAEVGADREGPSAPSVVPVAGVAGVPVASSPSGGARAAAVSRRAHRWVSVAKDSPVKHCERCHLMERAWRKHGGQPEVCDG